MKTSNINEERNDLGLIYHAINKMKLGYMEDEIIDIAFIGYTRALNTYKEEYCAFSTYVYACIKNEIGHFLTMKNYDVRKANYDSLSLNYVIKDDGELMDFIVDDYNLEESTINKIMVEKITEIAKEILTVRQYQVFNLSYLLGYKNVEVAKILGVSGERVRCIKKDLLNRLKRNKKIQKLKEDQ